MNWNWIGPPIDVRPFLPVDRHGLLELLAGLDGADWTEPTACPGWSVHDVVAHIAHDHIRRLSGTRDGYASAGFRPGEELAAFIDRVNQDFVETARAWSPAILVDLIAHLGPQLDDVWAGLDLDGPAAIDVAWAEPGTVAPAWLDVAREFSEFWIHQQQVRDAVGDSAVAGDEVTGAVVDTLIRGLPLTLAPQPAGAGTRVGVQVTGVGARSWVATREPDRWHLSPAGGVADCDAAVKLSADTLWRVASRGISPDVAGRRAVITGDGELARAALTLLSIIR
ncbi:MAG TPA: maleylpyruvate isomerase family mycothiol-dependent enzyme [Propionicimonas sp.]